MKKNVLAAIFLCATFSIQAQQTIPASGGNTIGSGGTTSFSVGQLVYNSNSGSGGSSNQGVQQSFEIFTLSNPELKTITLKLLMYPNPAKDYVVLSLTDSNITTLNYALYNIQGKAVKKGSVNQGNTLIGMQGLASGTYILRVNQINKELKTFKIIKN